MLRTASPRRNRTAPACSDVLPANSGIIAPHTHGVTLVSDEGEFDARRWYRVLAEQRGGLAAIAVSAVGPLAFVALVVPQERHGGNEVIVDGAR